MNASETEYKMNPQNCAKHDRGTCTCAFLYIAPHFNSRKLFHLIQKGIVAIMGLKTAQTNPWIADGWFKEFRRGFNLWGEVKEETIEFRKLLGFLVGDWVWLLTVTWAGQGFPQVTPRDAITSHWSQSIYLLIDAPRETLHSLFADVTHFLSEPTSSYCLDGKLFSSSCWFCLYREHPHTRHIDSTIDILLSLLHHRPSQAFYPSIRFIFWCISK